MIYRFEMWLSHGLIETGVVLACYYLGWVEWPWMDRWFK